MCSQKKIIKIWFNNRDVQLKMLYGLPNMISIFTMDQTIKINVISSRFRNGSFLFAITKVETALNDSMAYTKYYPNEKLQMNIVIGFSIHFVIFYKYPASKSVS